MKTIDQIYQKVVEMELPPGARAEVNELIATALRAGATWALPTDPLAGYSNLTAAISAGEPIDWEKLDGLKVKCVNPEVRGEIHGTLKQDGSLEPYLPGAWWDRFSNAAYINALYDGWYGNDGWTLWAEGAIPTRRKTADQLKVGVYFWGQVKGDSPCLVYVGSLPGSDKKTVYYAPEMFKSSTPASKWVVLEEYGTFQKPEGK